MTKFPNFQTVLITESLFSNNKKNNESLSSNDVKYGYITKIEHSDSTFQKIF
jgi:hypothetical protein